MAEYINRDTVITVLKNFGKGCIEDGKTTFNPVDDTVFLVNAMKDIPTADVAPRAEVEKIFEEIEDVLNNIGYFDELDFEALKNKYAEGEK